MKLRDLMEHCFSYLRFLIIMISNFFVCKYSLFKVLSIFICISEKWKHKYFIFLYDFVYFREHWGIFLLDVKKVKFLRNSLGFIIVETMGHRKMCKRTFHSLFEM